jgi:hypothetical protein
VYLCDEDVDSSIAWQALRSAERLLSLASMELDALTTLFRRPYFSRQFVDRTRSYTGQVSALLLWIL